MKLPVRSDDRARILAEHGDLRVRLASLESAAARVVACVPGGMSELRAAVRGLNVAFRAHLVTEEAILLPLLSVTAAQGLHAEHDAQRSMLSALASDVDVDMRSPAKLAEDARWLVGALLEDMLAEDRILFEADCEGRHVDGHQG